MFSQVRRLSTFQSFNSINFRSELCTPRIYYFSSFKKKYCLMEHSCETTPHSSLFTFTMAGRDGCCCICICICIVSALGQLELFQTSKSQNTLLQSGICKRVISKRVHSLSRISIYFAGGFL